jgi:hypothetical protein
VRAVCYASCNDQLLSLHNLLAGLLHDFDIPARLILKTRDIKYLSFEVDPLENIPLLSISFVELVHSLSGDVFTFLYTEAVVQCKVGEVDASSEVIGF